MNDISYNSMASMSDKSLIEKIGGFIRHHRVNQNKSQAEVSAEANVSRSTLSLLERGESVNLNSLIQILRVLDLLYVLDTFTVNDTISPIQYAKLKKKKRQRASTKKTQIPQDDIEW